MVENTGTTHLPCKTTVRSDLVEQATLLSDIYYSLCPRGSRKYWYPTHKSHERALEILKLGGVCGTKLGFPKDQGRCRV